MSALSTMLRAIWICLVGRVRFSVDLGGLTLSDGEVLADLHYGR